jgi:hypothetical protein
MNRHGTDAMTTPEKNLHAKIPPALLMEAENVAQAEHITLDDVMRRAVERYIEDRRWQKVYRFGEQQARKLGIKEGDIDRIIHQRREKEREPENKERGR